MRGAPEGDASPGSWRIRTRARARVLGFVLSVVLLVSACGQKTEIVYVDPEEHGAYTPIGRGADLRVHKDGAHELQEKIQIGPDAADGHPAPYTPIGSAHGALVHPGGKHQVAPKVAIANERGSSNDDDHAPSAGASHTASASRAPSPVSAPAPGARPAAVANPASAAKPAAVAKPAASPASVSPLNPTTGLGAVPGKPSAGAPLVDDGEDDEFETVAGKIENIVGKSMLVETASGKARVRFADNVRVDRDALGSAADLKPGLFVGVLHAPAGPATSVRIYPTGPSMPRPGVVPMAGSRVGQITTFGTIIALQFGGLLLNTGGETTTVTLPGTVEILKPTSSASTELVAGAQVIASGSVTGDGTVVATGVRVTSTPRPER